MGSSNAAYVADDADIDKIIDLVIRGAFTNAGQSQASIDRIYIHNNKY